MKVPHSERGQAMAEAAVFSVMAVFLAFGLLALIPLHRARTAATAAALACAQFVSQAPDPAQAVAQAEDLARRTLEAAWSGTAGAAYSVQVWAEGERGCAITYRPPLTFGSGMGFQEPGWTTVQFRSQVEQWKARWP